MAIYHVYFKGTPGYLVVFVTEDETLTEAIADECRARGLMTSDVLKVVRM